MEHKLCIQSWSDSKDAPHLRQDKTFAADLSPAAWWSPIDFCFPIFDDDVPVWPGDELSSPTKWSISSWSVKWPFKGLMTWPL